jgi:hypothetical protein
MGLTLTPHDYQRLAVEDALTFLASAGPDDPSPTGFFDKSPPAVGISADLRPLASMGTLKLTPHDYQTLAVEDAVAFLATAGPADRRLYAAPTGTGRFFREKPFARAIDGRLSALS